MNRSNISGELAYNSRLIFVDGGSADQTVEIAGKYSEVLRYRKGKGAQKNRGVMLRLFEFIVNLRARLFKVMDADSGLFDVLVRDVAG